MIGPLRCNLMLPSYTFQMNELVCTPSVRLVGVYLDPQIWILPFKVTICAQKSRKNRVQIEEEADGQYRTRLGCRNKLHATTLT
jgi:hypothetical protein